MLELLKAGPKMNGCYKVVVNSQWRSLFEVLLYMNLFYCTTEINECESNPCINDGTCFDRVNGFDCLCATGWQGPQCQLNTDECSGRPCVHAHSCKDLLGDYTCICQNGWTGKDCNISKQNKCHSRIPDFLSFWCPYTCTRVQKLILCFHV